MDNLKLQDVEKKLVGAFEEVGIVIIPNAGDDDLDIRDYIEDSLVFISAIVAIEQKFQIEFPDELINFDSLVSFHAFANTIQELVEKQNMTA